MKRVIWLTCCFSWLLGSSLWAGPKYNNWQANGWQPIDKEDGIATYRKSFKDNNVKGVAGAGMIQASMAEIIWVLMDHDHKAQWVDKFSDAYTLENPGPLTSIQYAAFEMPLFIDDRDFVYRYDFTYDPQRRAVVVNVKSVKHGKAPETVGVRGEIVMGRYRLYEQPDGKQTYVEVEYLADPKGLLPTWLVNLVQKTWPLKTLQGLKRQVKKPFVKKHDIITKVLKPRMVQN
jgi:hypothetical protein